MFERHGGAGAKFTIHLEQPLKSLLLQIKRDILRTVKEERIVLREFCISEGLPSNEIPEVLTRGIDVASPNWKKKLQNPKFQSIAASVRHASLKTHAKLQSTLQKLKVCELERDELKKAATAKDLELKLLRKVEKIDSHKKSWYKRYARHCCIES
jgi:hypothetical protein